MLRNVGWVDEQMDKWMDGWVGIWAWAKGREQRAPLLGPLKMVIKTYMGFLCLCPQPSLGQCMLHLTWHKRKPLASGSAWGLPSRNNNSVLLWRKQCWCPECMFSLSHPGTQHLCHLGAGAGPACTTNMRGGKGQRWIDPEQLQRQWQ